MTTLKIGAYRHTKTGNVYFVEAVGRSTSDAGHSVRYRSVSTLEEWHRPLREWFEPNHDGTARFVRLPPGGQLRAVFSIARSLVGR